MSVHSLMHIMGVGTGKGIIIIIITISSIE
jgi:hypothetical protein